MKKFLATILTIVAIGVSGDIAYLWVTWPMSTTMSVQYAFFLIGLWMAMALVWKYASGKPTDRSTT